DGVGGLDGRAGGLLDGSLGELLGARSARGARSALGGLDRTSRARGRGGRGSRLRARRGLGSLAATAAGQEADERADDDERRDAEQDEVRNLVDHGASVSAGRSSCDARQRRENEVTPSTTCSIVLARPSAEA